MWWGASWGRGWWGWLIRDTGTLDWMTRFRLPLAAALVVGLVACGASDDSADGPSTSDSAPSTESTSTTVPTTATPPSTTAPSTTTSSTTTTTVPEWIVGAHPLPLRPDGLGEILPTPDVLVERSLPTQSDLPPPPDDGYTATIAPIDEAIRARMGPTWSPECPVHLDDLRYLNVSFWGFDGGHHTGELVVHEEVAADVVWAFGQLHEARFPLEEMRLITGADLDAAPTGDGNNTAAFVCRPMRGGTSWSEHAYGRAIDINPFHNPYVRGDLDSPDGIVIPELASAYLDRDWVRPGMIIEGGVVTEAFEAIGWTWGGTWSSPDLMHFSVGGR